MTDGSGPGPLLAGVLGRVPVVWTGPVVAAAGLAAIAVGVATVLAVAAVVRAVADAADGAPHAASLALAALGALASVVAATLVVHRLLLRALPAPDRAQRPATRPLPPSRTWPVALVACAATLVAAFWRTPDLATTAVGEGDARYWYWLGWRLAEQVRAGDLLPLGVDTVVWPAGVSLRPADGLLPAAVGTAWNLVVRDPTLAFNLATATALVTTVLAAMRLARTLAAPPVVAGLAGLSCATAAGVFVRLEGHYNLLFAFPAILLLDVGLGHVLSSDSSVPEPPDPARRFPVLRTAVLLVLAYLSSGYYLVFGVVGLAAILVAGGLGRRALGVAALRCLAAAALAAVVLSPLLVAKVGLERDEEAAGGVALSSGDDFRADATSVLVPPAGTLLPLDALADRNDGFAGNLLERTAFVGGAGALALGALVFLRSPARRPILASTGALWVLGLGTTLTVDGSVLAAGVRWLPMTALLELPGFAGVRAPNRSSFLLAALAAAAVAVVLGWLVRSSPRRAAWAAVVVTGLLVVATVRVPVARTTEPSGPLADALRSVAELPDPGAVLHLPGDCLDTIWAVEWQLLHGRPEVGCQGMAAAMPWRTGLDGYASADSWAALRCEPWRVGYLPVATDASAPPSPEAAVGLREELGVGVVVFHRRNLCPERADAILASLLAAGSVVGEDDDVVVIALARLPQQQQQE